MGFCTDEAPSTLIAANKNSTIPVPKDWSLEDAATVPIAYGIVLYAMVVSRLR